MMVSVDIRLRSKQKSLIQGHCVYSQIVRQQEL